MVINKQQLHFVSHGNRSNRGGSRELNLVEKKIKQLCSIGEEGLSFIPWLQESKISKTTETHCSPFPLQLEVFQ